MTPSVTDKTSISAETWRRHTDPPLLWIAVATASVTLHLLLFWLMRSYSFSLALGQHSSAAVPIEFIDSPSSHSLATTPVKPSHHQPSTTRPSVSAPQLPLTQENTNLPSPTTQDSNAIAFAHKTAIASQLNKQLPKKLQKKTTVEQKRASLETKPTTQPESIPKLEPTTPPRIDDIKPTSTPSPETPESKTPEPRTFSPLTPLNRKRSITRKPLTAVHKNPQSEPELKTPINTDTKTPEQKTASTEQQPSSPPNTTDPTTTGSSPDSLPKIDDRQQPSPPPFRGLPGNLPEQPGGDIKVGEETSLDKKGGGIAVATWEIEPGGIDIQDNPVKPKINSKLLHIPSLNNEPNRPLEFRVYLQIDNHNGKAMFVRVVSENIPAAQRIKYQEYAEEIFKDVEFTTASSNGGKEPPPSADLYLRIKIENH